MISGDSSKYKSMKILSLDAAAKKIEELKKANKSVGLCHGGFDLMHPGQIKHLESASSLCDCLFVSITSDKFVAMRKGKNRPIFSEQLRAYSAASLSYVGFVVINNFERATNVIEKLKPTYYIKGPDFINKTTPGITAEKERIRSFGGDILFTKDEKLSTTEIIKHMHEKSNQKTLLICTDRDGTLIDNVPFLGKEKNWKKQVKIKKDVIDFLMYLQTKYDTTKIVVSNQQGIARNHFKEERVDEVNKYINGLLERYSIKIDSWNYCGDVDKTYVEKHKDVDFNPQNIREKTARKPNTEMVVNAVKRLKKNIDDFDNIIVIGDEDDDAKLAKNLDVNFINASGKNYEGLKKMFEAF